MTTPEIKVTEASYDGIVTWATKGQVDKGQFLLALLAQHGESLNERIREGRRLPTVEDVDHVFGMPTECFDDTFADAETHKEVCDEPTCEFDVEDCFWVTWLCDEALWPIAPEAANGCPIGKA